MKLASKILAMVLTVALLAASLTTVMFADDHASPSSPASAEGTGERVARCHAHGAEMVTPAPLNPSSPQSQLPRSPSPLSYRCCLTGHDVALLQLSHLRQTFDQCTCLLQETKPALTESSTVVVEVSTVLFADPPPIIPLRV